MLKLLFWPVGRISRKDFWIGYIISYIASIFFGSFAYYSVSIILPFLIFLLPVYLLGIIPFYVPSPTMIVFCMLSLIPLYMFFVVTIKRYHDLRYSGWWSLFIFVPVVGMSFVLIECGFGPSRLLKNKWGEPVVGPLVKNKPKK